MAGKAVKCQACQNAIRVPAGASSAATQTQQATPITFNCQSCGRQYQVAAAMAGKQAKCQSCQAIMQVPASNAAAGAGALGGGLDSLFDEVTETDVARWQGSTLTQEGATYSPHNTSMAAPSKSSGAKPKTYKLEAMLLFLFMGGILAVPAIIYSNKVTSLYDSGDYRGAVEASNNAKKWCTIAGCVGGAVMVGGIMISILAAVLGAAAAT